MNLELVVLIVIQILCQVGGAELMINTLSSL